MIAAGSVGVMVFYTREEKVDVWSPSYFYKMTGKLFMPALSDQIYIEADSIDSDLPKFEIKMLPEKAGSSTKPEA